MNRRRSGALGGALASGLLAAGVLVAACGSGKDSGIDNAKLPDGVRHESIDHQSCNESGNKVETLDANNDAKFDVKIVYAGQTSLKLCLISDLNHDGRPDMFEYYDKKGLLRRREADYDESGTVDAIEDFKDGKLAERELDTTGQHRIDTWEFYDASGTLIRRERDTTNDGRIDQWTTFDAKHQTIAFDKNGDGRPDPNDTVVLNLDGSEVEEEADAAAPAPAATDAGPSPSASPALAAPLEDSLDAGADGGKGKGKKGAAAAAASRSEKTPKKIVTSSKDAGK